MGFIARFQNSRVECIVLKGTDIRGARKSIEKSSLCCNEERVEVTYRMLLVSNVALQSYSVMLLRAPSCNNGTREETADVLWC